MAEAAVDTGSSSSQASQGQQTAGLMSSGNANPTTTTSTQAPAQNGQGNGQSVSQQVGQGQTDAGNDNWRSKWSAGLAEDEKPVWDNISQRYKSEADMAKAHVSLVRSMDKRLAIPDENAKPEEWDTVYQKLGMPAKAEDYKFDAIDKVPHWDDERKNQMRGLAPLFRKARATQSQVNEFLQQQAELDKVAQDAFLAKANSLNQTYDRQMQTEWGRDYQKNQNLAAMTVKHYAGADAEKLAAMRTADGTFVLDTPEMRRFLSKIGNHNAEDDRDPTSFNTGMAVNVKAQIDQIYEEMKEKGISPSDPNFPHKRIEDLQRKIPGYSRNDYGRSY